MRRLNTAANPVSRRVNTLAPAVCLVLGLIAVGPPAQAQDAPAERSRDGGLSEGPVRQAFSVAENWIQRGRVPDSTLSVRMKGVTAVHVTVRSGGPTFGQATETIDNPAEPQPGDAEDGEAKDGEGQTEGRDLMQLVRPAVQEALREAYGRIGGAADRTEAGSQMTLDLQVAGRPERIEITQLGELPSKITVNVDGLAMKQGSKWVWQFPGNSIAANTNLKGQIERLLSAADLPLVQLEKVGQADGPALYRFPVIHIVRPTPDQPAVRLHRGNQPLPPRPLGDNQLASLNRRLADHLMNRQRADGRFAGTYEPTADQFNPTTASDFDAARAAFALARAARVPGLDNARRDTLGQAARNAVQSLVDRLAVPAARRDRPRRLPSAAATMLALLETPGLSAMKEQRVRLARTLETLQRDDGLFDMGTDDREPAPLMMQGVGAAALAALYDQRRDPEVLERTRRALDAIWQRHNPEARKTDGDFDATLPWLAYAELDLARLGHPTEHLEDLFTLCEQLWRRQLVPWETPDSGEPSPDAVGGFVEPDSLMEEPTWETAPRLAAQALMLRDPQRIPSDRRPRWLIRCGLGARFLSQLTLGRATCYYCRSPSTAAGGTRMTFWNNRQPLPATAASLLAVTELQHALHRLRKEAEAASSESSKR